MDTAPYLRSIFSLEDKTIMIIGTSGGIGLAISESLARCGAEVALCNCSLDTCLALAEKINADGGKATVHQMDVSKMDDIHTCVSEVMKAYGKIDVLFNIAGINRREGLLNVKKETYDNIMNIDLKGLYKPTGGV